MHMAVNWKWSAPARTIFRLLAGLVGIVAVSMGGLLVWEQYDAAETFASDSSGRAGIAMLILGVVFLLVAIRGRIVRRDIG